jgi:integrase/recombinase XerD
MERFAEWMRLRNWSEETIKSYRSSLRQFFAYLESQGVDSFAAVSRELLEGFRTHLFYRQKGGKNSGKPLSVTTQAARLTAAKTFLKFLVRENILLVDVSSSVDLPRLPATLPKVLSEEEVVRLVEAPDVSTQLGIRDRALLENLYATGVRNGEMGALSLPDIDWEHQALWVRLGKGQKSRLVPLGEEALAWLQEYLHRVRPQLATSDAQLHVFLSYQGRPLTRGAVIQIVGRYAQKVGLTEVTPHTLRHSCATHMMRRGAGIRHLQEILGHSSPITTQHYTQVELSELHKVLRRCHPRERGFGR